MHAYTRACARAHTGSDDGSNFWIDATSPIPINTHTHTHTQDLMTDRIFGSTRNC